MKFDRFITGLCRVAANPDRRNTSIHAGCAGITGFTGLSAHARVQCLLITSFPIKQIFFRARNTYPANPVNPVTSHINQGFQRIRVALIPCTTLIKSNAMSKKSLRENMPAVTAFIDSLREAFGKEMIDAQIRKGMKGEPVFWASENGHEIGTQVDVGATYRVTWDPVTGLAKGEEIGK